LQEAEKQRADFTEETSRAFWNKRVLLRAKKPVPRAVPPPLKEKFFIGVGGTILPQRPVWYKLYVIAEESAVGCVDVHMTAHMPFCTICRNAHEGWRVISACFHSKKHTLSKETGLAYGESTSL